MEPGRGEGPMPSGRFRSLRAAVRGATGRFGCALLSNAFTRDWLNSALRKRGCVQTAWYPRLFDRFQPSKPFLWLCSFRGRDIIIPVLPRYRHSWLVAFSMHWHEKHLVRLWDRFLEYRPSPVFLDVGANFGLHTYRLAAAGATCFAIEPQSECLSYLSLVSALNDWRVTAAQIAIAEKPGTVILHRAKGTFTSSLLEDWVQRWDKPASVQEVPSTTLDAFCLEHRCVPDLIKIDVEGAEERVIVGASECLRSRRATWVIESIPETGSRGCLWESFTPLGYVVYRVGRSGLRKVSELREFIQEPEWEFLFSCDRQLLDHLNDNWA